MPRVRFTDEQATSGELDLARVHVGDRARLLDALHQLAGPQGTIDVEKDTIGEVVAVAPESLRVRLPIVRRVRDDFLSEVAELDLFPNQVTILVDARDPRIGDGRIAGGSMSAAIETWELEAAVQSLRGVNLLRQSAVVTELVRCQQRQAARIVARATPAAWQVFVLDAGLAAPRRQAADAADFLEQYGWYAPEAYELAEWAISAVSYGLNRERVKHLDIARRSDVLSALDELIADVRGGPYTTSTPSLVESEDGFDYLESVEPGASTVAREPDLERHIRDTAGELEKARRFIAEMDEDRWMAFVQAMQSRSYDTPAPSPTVAEPPVSADLPTEAAPLEPEEEDTTGLMAPAVADPELLLPIGLPPGQGRQRIFATPGMRVFSKSRGEEGDVVGGATTVLDGIVVDLGDRQDVWDAMDVCVSTRWRGPRRLVPFDAIEQWKRDRRERLRGQSGHVACYQAVHGRSDQDDGSAPDARRAPRAGREGGTHPSHRVGSRRADRGDRSGAEPAPTADPGTARIGAVFLLDDGPSAVFLDGFGAELELFHREALAPLGVRELRRWLNGPGEFAVISAYKQQPKSQNQRAHGDLMGELQRRGYSPSQIRPLRGQYFTPQGAMKAEQSFLILGMPYAEAIDLGRELGQESVIYKSPEGVVGAYYTDGSGRVNLALANGDLALGDAGTAIRERAPKPERRGPPSPADPWSKARSIGFEFPIDWSRAFQSDPTRPLSLDEARRQLHAQKLVHYSTTPGLTALNPGYHGSGQLSRSERQDMRVPVTFFYFEGTQPESLLVSTSRARYTAELPPGAKLLDLADAPDWVAQAWREDGRGGMYMAIKNNGFFGFFNSASALPNAVAVFHELPVVETEHDRQRLVAQLESGQLSDRQVEDAIVGPFEQELAASAPLPEDAS